MHTLGQPQGYCAKAALLSAACCVSCCALYARGSRPHGYASRRSFHVCMAGMALQFQMPKPIFSAYHACPSRMQIGSAAHCIPSAIGGHHCCTICTASHIPLQAVSTRCCNGTASSAPAGQCARLPALSAFMASVQLLQASCCTPALQCAVTASKSQAAIVQQASAPGSVRVQPGAACAGFPHHSALESRLTWPHQCGRAAAPVPSSRSGGAWLHGA